MKTIIDYFSVGDTVEWIDVKEVISRKGTQVRIKRLTGIITEITGSMAIIQSEDYEGEISLFELKNKSRLEDEDNN